MFFTDAISIDELDELRRSQVVYIEWATARMVEKADNALWIETYHRKIQMASAMTTRIDVELQRRGAY